MAKGRLTSRYWTWRATDGLARLLPPLRRALTFYPDAVPAADRADRVAIDERRFPLALGPAEQAFAARLPEPLPSEAHERIEVLRLNGVTVRGDTGRVFDERLGRLVLFDDMQGSAHNHVRPALLRAVDKPGAYLHVMAGDRGHRQFFHFFLDRIPQLYQFLRLGPGAAGPVRVLTNSGLADYQRDFFRLLAEREPRIELVQIPTNERWRVETLHRVVIARNVKSTATDPAFLAFVRRLYAEGYGIAPTGPARRRLFISRLDARKRRVTNEAALYPFLERHGFEIVAAARLSFREQVALFAEAECIVGAHGAGLTNILHAPKGARLVELFPADKIKNTYFLLAHTLGHRHSAVIGTAGDGREAFGVDPAAFEQAVSQALEAEAPTKRSGKGAA